MLYILYLQWFISYVYHLHLKMSLSLQRIGSGIKEVLKQSKKSTDEEQLKTLVKGK